MPNITTSKVNYTAYFDFGSPRYRSAYNQSAKYVPDDYPYHDNVNGTYDAYFPLYRITASDPPVMYLKGPTSSTKVTGELGLAQYQLNARIGKFGAIKDSSERPYNDNLELQEVTFNEWDNLPINPGWDVLVNTYLVKLLGNSQSLQYIHAFDLDNYIGGPTAQLPKNTYAKYKNNIWRSRVSTFNLPPEDVKQQSSNWQYIPPQSNVFNAAVYNITQGKTAFLYEIKDDLREFNPLNDPENNLVCWNAAFYPS
jgi:hypothetical protein